jgi:hypothetical protein
VKKIKYIVYDLAGEESRAATASSFLLEIPELMMFGVIAPFGVTNQILKGGKSGGGMSPGVEWDPFEITKEEYQEIIDDILGRSKQGHLPGPHGTTLKKAFVDKEFDDYTEWVTWMKDVTKKYSDRIIEISEDEQIET